MTFIVEIGSHQPVTFGASDHLTWSDIGIISDITDIISRNRNERYNKQNGEFVYFNGIEVEGTLWSVDNRTKIECSTAVIFSPEDIVLRNSYRFKKLLYDVLGGIQRSVYVRCILNVEQASERGVRGLMNSERTMIFHVRDIGRLIKIYQRMNFQFENPEMIKEVVRRMNCFRSSYRERGLRDSATTQFLKFLCEVE